MSTHTVQDTEVQQGVDHVDTQGVIMKDTETTTTETLSSPAPSRPPRGVATAAGLIVFATVTLTPWLLTSGSDSLPPIMPTQAAAPTQQAAPAVQARASSNAGSAKPVAGYALFCQNSPSLCAPAASTQLDPGYVRFCWNNPTLCVAWEPRQGS
jgi:hypothetical protein